MNKQERFFLRGLASNIQILREAYFLKNKNNLLNKFLVVKLRHFPLFLIVDTSDEWGIHLLKYGYIENPEEKFVKKIVKKGDIVFDIGAHWGGFSTIFGKITGNKGTVFSFEPSRKNFKILKKNICINKLKKIVSPFNMAVGSEEGFVEISIAKTSSGHNSIVRKDMPIKFTEKVKQISIDTFCKQNNIEKISFFKIDVEGYEFHVIDGMKNTLDRVKNAWMFIEYSPMFMGKEEAEELLNILKYYFDDIYIGHKKKIRKTSWEEAKSISFDYGQRNLFLYKK